MFKNAALVALLGAFACNDKDDTAGDSGTTDTTGGTEMLAWLAGWDTDDQYSIEITEGSGSFDFGMAETGAGGKGWYGENCLGGAAGYDICHSFSAASPLVLDSVHPDVGGAGLDALVENSTTLLWAALGITYYLADKGTGECWTWGDETTYYTSEGCSVAQ